MSRRTEKVNSLIQQQIGHILAKDVDLNTKAMVTVSSVDTADDLRDANVRVSIFPYDLVPDTFALLEERAGEIQHLLNRRLSMRFVPRIRFILDSSEQKASHIYGLIKETKDPESL